MTDYAPTSLEGVPAAGRARLEQNKRGLFTSDLSVAEFLLVKEAGFDPHLLGRLPRGLLKADVEDR